MSSSGRSKKYLSICLCVSVSKRYSLYKSKHWVVLECSFFNAAIYIQALLYRPSEYTVVPIVSSIYIFYLHVSVHRRSRLGGTLEGVLVDFALGVDFLRANAVVFFAFL